MKHNNFWATASLCVMSSAVGMAQAGGADTSGLSQVSRKAVPTISSITPQQVPCGASFTVTLGGSHFSAKSVVYINQTVAPTTYLSSTSLRATGLVTVGSTTLAIRIVDPFNGTSALNKSVTVGACVTPPPPPPITSAPTIGGCEVFPASAVFNTRIDDLVRFPAHPSSATWISKIGTSRALHMDFGNNVNQANYATYYGIPYNVVDGTAATTAWPTVSFAQNGGGWPDESHCATPDATHSIKQCSTELVADRRFPYPNADIIKTESGACNDPASCGDRHVLVLEKGACRLWESYFSYKVNNQWAALSTAAWDMKTNAMRPAGWTSGDAAGLPMLPLLMRADEAAAGAIRHAFRVTFRDSVLANTYVWPARHAAGGATAGGIPFGALLRLKSDFAIPATWSVQSKAVALAMQRYGVYVSDIGSDAYFTGEPSASWSATTISELQHITMSSFEFVNTGAITSNPKFNVNSFQAAW